MSLQGTASPDSPHLLPSPASSKTPPAAAHLGWSDSAKKSFDKVRSSVQSPRHHQQKQQREPTVIHLQTPARALDERQMASSQGAESGGSKGEVRLFGGLMDSWRQVKAEKRREDLRKMIRVVAPGAEQSESADKAARPTSGVQRRSSAFNWM